MWTAIDCKTLRDYHELYVKLDVTLLADVMTHFRNVSYQTFGLDPIH